MTDKSTPLDNRWVPENEWLTELHRRQQTLGGWKGCLFTSNPDGTNVGVIFSRGDERSPHMHSTEEVDDWMSAQEAALKKRIAEATSEAIELAMDAMHDNAIGNAVGERWVNENPDDYPDDVIDDC